MVDFVTGYESHQEDPQSSVVLVSFQSTALFDTDSPQLPSRVELETELGNAFRGTNLDGYLGMVQALPTSNLFSTTTQIYLMLVTPEGSTNGEGRSGTAILATSFGVLIACLLVSFAWYRHRRRSRRRQASDKFMKLVAEIDSSASGRTLSQSNEGQSVLCGTEELEEIEVSLCETAGQMDDLRRVFSQDSQCKLIIVEQMNYEVEDELSQDEEPSELVGMLKSIQRSECVEKNASFEDSSCASSHDESVIEGTPCVDIKR